MAFLCYTFSYGEEDFLFLLQLIKFPQSTYSVTSINLETRYWWGGLRKQRNGSLFIQELGSRLRSAATSNHHGLTNHQIGETMVVTQPNATSSVKFVPFPKTQLSPDVSRTFSAFLVN